MHRVPTAICSTIFSLGLLPALPPAHAGGNVTAVVEDGLLLLKGDNQDNTLSITTTGAPAGGVRLVPFPGTTINGGSPPFIDVSDIPHGVRASFGGGEDDFDGNDGLAGFPGDLTLDMGGADDNVAIVDLDAQRCDLGLGSGRDDVGLVGTACGELALHGGGGDDIIGWFGGSVTGATKIDMGGGPDVLQLSGVTFGGPFRVAFGAGGDFLDLNDGNAFQGAVTFGGGTGSDALADDGSTSFAFPPEITSIP